MYILCVLCDFPTDANMCRKCSENCLKCTSYSICTECKPDIRWNKFSDDAWINCSVNTASSLPAAENTDSPCAHILCSIITITKGYNIFNSVFKRTQALSFPFHTQLENKHVSSFLFCNILTWNISNSPYCWVRSFQNAVFTDSVHQVLVVVCCRLGNWAVWR